MNNTARIYDVINKSLTGPIMTEKDFDMKCIASGIKNVLKKYEIVINQENPINLDDEMADRVWQAAVEFLADCGVYHQNTGRIIKYSKEEILQYVRRAPSQVTHGRGGDKVVESWRSIEDERPPVNAGCPVGCPIPDELFIPSLQSYIQEELVDMVIGPTFEKIRGMDVRTGTPLEILAAWEEVRLVRKAMDSCGRPGMPYIGVAMSVSDVGQLSAVGRGDYAEGNTHTFGIISELKTNDEILNKLTHSIMQGGTIDPYANPIYGGLAGGAAGQAVLLTAEMIALSVMFMATCNGSSPTHPFYFNDTGREALAYQSLAYQAIARNSKILTNLTLTPVGGPGTKTLLYECVAFSAMCTKSGLTRMLGPRSATGVINGHFSGLEARFCGEVMRATTKISREKANEIVEKALKKYEALQDTKPYGKPFWEVYDVDTVTPKQEWLDLYEEVKKEVTAWGLPLDLV
jgi:hypothetical protein